MSFLSCISINETAATIGILVVPFTKYNTYILDCPSWMYQKLFLHEHTEYQTIIIRVNITVKGPQ